MGYHTRLVSQVGVAVLHWLRCVCISSIFAKGHQKTFIIREKIKSLALRFILYWRS